MAKARGSAPDPPAEPEQDPGEEEEDASSEQENEGSGSESDSESKQTPTKKPPSAPATKPAPSATSSDEDDSGSDSDSDSDSPLANPDPNIKPIASKPMDSTPKPTSSKKPRSKPTTHLSKLISPPGAGSKRSAAGDVEEKETKKSKKKLEKGVEETEKKGAPNDESRKLFQRLWSEDDEIVILKGMVDYWAKKKADPGVNLSDFHEFIKKLLHIDVSKQQLQDKVRRLKKKYENNAVKVKKGKEKIFTKDHEQKAFELSKKVWGNNENDASERKTESPKANGEVSKRSRSKTIKSPIGSPVVGVGEEVDKKHSGREEKGVEGSEFVDSNSRKLGIEEWVMDKGIELINGEKRAEIEEKWRNFRVEEVEMYAKKLELMLEETKLVIDAMKTPRK